MELSNTIVAENEIYESFESFYDKELSFSIEEGFLNISVFFAIWLEDEVNPGLELGMVCGNLN
ncbi:MAG: hypothetical protein WCR67_07555 [Bacilli bacterium]